MEEQPGKKTHIQREDEGKGRGMGREKKDTEVQKPPR
jgi:hypothetical protein